ncbi:MAG: hypothetical protein Q4C20_08655 [Erysipelotrichaceae bacterium]|nr:hypothetical protein [Erysipelotrichaceae bacterium]
MKNKDRYDLSDLDYIADGDIVEIVRIGYRDNIIAVVQRMFDESAFHAFLRWLEEEIH